MCRIGQIQLLRVGDYLRHNILLPETFQLHPDPNHNLNDDLNANRNPSTNPDPNPKMSRE